MKQSDVHACADLAVENLLTALEAISDPSEYRLINHDGIRVQDLQAAFRGMVLRFLRDRGIEVEK